MQRYLKRFYYISLLCFILFGGCTTFEYTRVPTSEKKSALKHSHCYSCLCSMPEPIPESILEETISEESLSKTTPASKTGPTRKYAVLISAGVTKADNSWGDSEYWYDLVSQYQLLKDHGFEDGNIYVLYGTGTDFVSGNHKYNSARRFGHSITKAAANATDAAVTKANIEGVFKELNGKVTKNDHLYVWWMGHGSSLPRDPCYLSLFIGYTDEHVHSLDDEELSKYIGLVSNYKKRTIAIMTCHSGGFIDDMSIVDNKTVTLVSSKCEESSYSYVNSSACDDIFHAEFNYTLTNALRQKDPCDSPILSNTYRDGYVSLLETHQYNEKEMAWSTPLMGDPDGISRLEPFK